MLLMFCGKNKGNKKGRVPSEELDLNLYCAQKVLADTNNSKSVIRQTFQSVSNNIDTPIAAAWKTMRRQLLFGQSE